MDFVKLKISTLWKALFRKSEDKPQTGKNICKHISNKGFVSKYTKNSNTNNPIKNRESSE